MFGPLAPTLRYTQEANRTVVWETGCDILAGIVKFVKPDFRFDPSREDLIACPMVGHWVRAAGCDEDSAEDN